MLPTKLIDEIRQLRVDAANLHAHLATTILEASRDNLPDYHAELTSLQNETAHMNLAMNAIFNKAKILVNQPAPDRSAQSTANTQPDRSPNPAEETIDPK